MEKCVLIMRDDGELSLAFGQIAYRHRHSDDEGYVLAEVGGQLTVNFNDCDLSVHLPRRPNDAPWFVPGSVNRTLLRMFTKSFLIGSGTTLSAIGAWKLWA